MFRFAHDRWTSRQGLIIPYDKLEHLLGSFLLTLFLSIFLNPYLLALTTLTLAVLWEIKDALFPFETYGILGGDGFSFRDLAADYLGILLYLCLNSYAFS